MAEIALVLSNTRPQPADGSYEHLFLEKSPRWLFAQLQDPASSGQAIQAAVAKDADALALTATPLGPRVGAGARGPVALWVVLTNPVAGKEAEYNAWYNNRHLDDSLAIPGIVAGRRYKVTDAVGPESARWAYLALYEIELDRAAEALAEAAARAGGPKMPNPGYLAPGTAALPFRPMA